jgi:hypothetical protein
VTRISFGSKGGRIKTTAVKEKPASARPVEDVVRDMKKSQAAAAEDYRERSLAIHGLICARCAREFDHTNRHLLTVHHKDGNHDNNPPDGSNWENLCVYCHEDTHSRSVLGDYFDGAEHKKESTLVYTEEKTASAAMGSLGAKLQDALKKRKA